MKQFTLSLALVFFTACSVGPNYVRPTIPMQDDWSTSGISWKSTTDLDTAELDSTEQVSTERDLPEHGSWWDYFEDPVLSSLLANVRMGSYDIRIAYRRVTQAYAVIGRERSFFLPGIVSNPNFRRFQFSKTEQQFPGGLFSDYEIPFNFTYELDVWGKIRRSVESSQALAESSEADLEFASLRVTAEAANRYFTLQALEREIAILNSTRATRDENRRLVQARVNAGTADRLDLSRALSELRVVEADLERIQGLKQTTLYALAVLEGQTPEKFSLSVSPLSCTPPELPKILPSDLLRSRPDIVSAEALAKSASAQIGVAQSVFFPSFNLNAFAGVSSGYSDRLLKAASRIWSLSPSFTLPLFQGGRNISNLEVAEQVYLESIERYRSTVLQALGEVESALVNVRQQGLEAEKLSEAVAAASETTKLSKERYLEGLVSYFDVVDAERQQLELERSLNATCGQRYLASVELVRALGGGLLAEKSTDSEVDA
ncbi:MAG: efflux transporter outer membrane subunit [Bdellovibrionales bacterium]|nr:efflux transporter outer membrane subunit [Bdellovibrionales bacterium]